MRKAAKKKAVEYEEVTSIKVGNFLLSKGLDIANSDGVGCSLMESSELGILRRNPEARPSWSFLLSLIESKPRREFLGVIWFNNNERGAYGRNWVFEVRGRVHVEFVRQLAKEMASTFNINIRLLLVREQADREKVTPELCI